MANTIKPEQAFRDEDEFNRYMEDNPDLWDSFLQQVVWKKEIQCLRIALYELTQSDNITTSELALMQLERSLERCPDDGLREAIRQRRLSIERAKSAFPIRKLV